MLEGELQRRRMSGRILLGWLFVFFMLVPACLFCASARGRNQQPSPLLREIWTLIQQGHLSEARTRLNVAIQANPRSAGVWVLLGIVEAQQRHFSAAEQDFKKSIELEPKFLSGYINLGHLYQEQIATVPKAWGESVATYMALLKVDAGNTEANFQLALLLESHGQFQDSLAHIDGLPGAIRKQRRVLALTVADYVGIGNYKQAEAASVELMATADLTEADVTPVLAVLEARHQEALETYLLSKLAARGLASFAALQRLGELYARQGKLPEARKTLEEVAVRKPHPIHALLDLARIADQQEDYVAALGYLARARDIEPENASIHYSFGIVCVQENLSQDAYTSLKRAVALKPDNPYYNYALGAVILDRQDTMEAVPYFKKYIQLKPGDPRGKLGLGAAYFLSHNLSLASQEFKAIKDFPQTRAGAHYFLGRIANLQGDLGRAAAELTLALKDQPDYAGAYAQMGLVRMNQKQYGPAEDAFRTALRINPDNYLANLNLMILYQRTHDARAKEQEQKFSSIKAKRALMAKRFLRSVKVVR